MEALVKKGADFADRRLTTTSKSIIHQDNYNVRKSSHVNQTNVYFL